MSPALSIVIPTHKRAGILQRCIRHIEAQTMKDQLEVIVVSDGPDEPTRILFAKEKWQVPVVFREIEKSQQGTARNHAMDRVTAPLTLFIGDDIFLLPDACEKHISLQQTLEKQGLSPSLTLGHITWDPNLDINRTMRWLEKTGWQFGYPHLEIHAQAMIPPTDQHLYTYASHLCVPTDIARAHPFREDMILYGWEDTEWGMRLRDAGVRLFYQSEAKAVHHHHMTLEDSLRRMRTIGKSAVHLERMVPGFDRVPKGGAFYTYVVLSILPSIRGKHARAFLKGVKDGQKDIAQMNGAS